MGSVRCLRRSHSACSSLLRSATLATVVFLSLSVAAQAVPRRDKDGAQYGAGLIVNVPFSEAEVVQVVQDVAQNGIIRGTKEYAKDEYVTGAHVAPATRVFPAWAEGGKVFYKVRLKALDPWNFKDSNDMGTLAVRYVVQGQDAAHTVLRIDARFVEDFRHISHASNGSVEGEEYKSIHDHLDALEVMKTQTADANKKQEATAKLPAAILKDESSKDQSILVVPQTVPVIPPPAAARAPEPAVSPAPAQSLEDHVKDLRHLAERLVKAPGAPLKSAPFHSASTLQSLSSGTEVLIVISTPYWLGVETHDGQHGWILRDQLELLP